MVNSKKYEIKFPKSTDQAIVDNLAELCRSTFSLSYVAVSSVTITSSGCRLPAAGIADREAAVVHCDMIRQTAGTCPKPFDTTEDCCYNAWGHRSYFAKEPLIK